MPLLMENKSCQKVEDRETLTESVDIVYFHRVGDCSKDELFVLNNEVCDGRIGELDHIYHFSGLLVQCSRVSVAFFFFFLR